MNSKIQYWLSESIIALFLLLFVYTGVIRITDRAAFEEAMWHSTLIAPYAGALSWLIPIIEIAISFCLIIPRTRISGLIAATILMCLFTLYIGYMFITASQLPCTCGGIIESMTWQQHLAFNSIFTSLGVIGIILNKNFIAINRRSRIPV